MHERSFAIGPVLPEWSWRIASYISYDEDGSVFDQVSYTYINTRINMFLINKNPLNNVFSNVISYSGLVLTQPLKCEFSR